MNGTNLFKIALRALANNKLRAFLTMLGIIIGVASVITMLAIGQGSKRSIQQQISEMGSNMIMIHPGADRRGGVRQDPSAMQTLKLTDYEALRDETNFLSAISPNVSSSGQLIAGNNNYPSSVSGVGLEYLEIRQLSVETGDMFTEADIQSSAKVCVIGKTIVDNLFPDGGDQSPAAVQIVPGHHVKEFLLDVQQFTAAWVAQVQLGAKGQDFPFHPVKKILIDIKDVIAIADGKDLLPDIHVHMSASFVPVYHGRTCPDKRIRLS